LDVGQSLIWFFCLARFRLLIRFGNRKPYCANRILRGEFLKGEFIIWGDFDIKASIFFHDG